MRDWNIRGRLTYANVASSLALFAALGGTSYALTLPRNSVGAAQLRRGSVGASEIRKGAVHSSEIRNGAIAVNDISAGARRKLAGRRGPPGTPAVGYFLLADSAGNRLAGNGSVIGSSTINDYVVRFPRSIAGCALVASPARAGNAAVPDPPRGSTAIVGYQGTDAYVRTFGGNGQPEGLPFALIAAC